MVEHWREQKYHPGKVMATPDRVQRVLDRLAEGFSAEDLKLAIEGVAHDDWLMGRTTRGGKKYLGIETCLRDAAQVERLSALRTAAKNGDIAASVDDDPPEPPSPPRIAWPDGMHPDVKRYGEAHPELENITPAEAMKRLATFADPNRDSGPIDWTANGGRPDWSKASMKLPGRRVSRRVGG